MKFQDFGHNGWQHNCTVVKQFCDFFSWNRRLFLKLGHSSISLGCKCQGDRFTNLFMFSTQHNRRSLSMKAAVRILQANILIYLEKQKM